MLHVANGASTAAGMRGSGLGGQVVDLDDLMAEGPVPNGLAGPAGWQARAAWLERHFEIPSRDYLARQAERARVVDGARGEVVLWFEYDLHCQANLIHLLSRDWPDAATLALVCPDRVSDVPDFRGLGQLTAAQLATLFAGRVRLGPEDRAHAREIWTAWCDERPVRLAAVARAGRFSAAIAAHLRRLPSTRDGLNDIERALLALVPPDGTHFTSLFAAWNATDAARPYGFGDYAIAHTVRTLSRGDGPPVAVDGPTPPRLAECAAWHVRPTGASPEAWRSNEDRRLGGVCVPGATPRWCWDANVGAPVWIP